MNVRKWIILFTAIGVVVLFTPSTNAGNPAPPRGDYSSFGVQRFEKKKAPSFFLKGLDQNKIALKELKGKPIILTFWATWCSPCKEELPTLEKFAEGRKDRLTILTIAIDGENEKQVQSFVKENNITLPVLLDVKGEIARTYRVRMIPTTFLIDGEGFMVGMIPGERDWSLREAWLAVRELLFPR